MGIKIGQIHFTICRIRCAKRKVTTFMVFDYIFFKNIKFTITKMRSTPSCPFLTILNLRLAFKAPTYDQSKLRSISHFQCYWATERSHFLTSYTGPSLLSNRPSSNGGKNKRESQVRGLLYTFVFSTRNTSTESNC